MLAEGCWKGCLVNVPNIAGASQLLLPPPLLLPPACGPCSQLLLLESSSERPSLLFVKGAIVSGYLDQNGVDADSSSST